VSGDRLNSLPSDIVVILPLTSRDRRLTWHYRLEVGATGLSVTSFAMCEQLRTISNMRLRRYIGEVESGDLHQIMEIVYWMLS
jgi:mRNA interferase MazF